MPGGYRELPDITADLGIEAWGSGLEEAFSSTIRGLATLMSDVPASRHPLVRHIHIESASLESLLVQLLNEIVFLEETENFLPGEVAALSIRGSSVDVSIEGDTFNPEIHNIGAHIKAATYHGLKILEEGNTFRIRVIFDV